VLPQALDIGEQVMRGIARQRRGGIGSVRNASATSTLVELDDAVALRIEPSAPAWITSTPRPAMEDDCGLPAPIPRSFPVDRLAISDVEHA
jgi:hypothetical protein